MPLNRRQVLTAGAAALAGGLLVEPLRATAVPLFADGSAGGSVWSATPQTPVTSGAAVAPSGNRFMGDPTSGKLYYGCSMVATLSWSALENATGAPLTLHRSYFIARNVAGLVRQVVADHAASRMPVTSTKLPASWASVASGAQDAWLDDLLSRLHATGKPVMLCLHHEPENDANKGSGMAPSDYVKMYNRAISKAASIAPNVTMLPILMSWTLDKRSGRNPADWMVPNAKAFGCDIYNQWSPTDGMPWMPFATRADLVPKWAAGRPIVVAEHGCRTDPKSPGKAAGWMADAFNWCVANNVVGLSYFDSNQHSRFGSWVLDAERTKEMGVLLRNSAVVKLA
jgi:hypothetical protein